MSQMRSVSIRPFKSADPMSRFGELYSPEPTVEVQLAHVKRFLERWTGDDVFRSSILNGQISFETAAAVAGCRLDVGSLLPVFHPDFVGFRNDATADTWPLTALWNEFIGSALQIRNELVGAGYSQGVNEEFDSWRARQIGRTFLDLGAVSASIVHPVVAIELSSGCSVGCSFCGLTAERFRGHATLSDAEVPAWKETILALKSFFGDALKTGFLYWATDPLDNPDYLKFLDLWIAHVDAVPQTTTAIPLRNLDMTRDVLQRWRHKRGIPNRFSILTTKMLCEVHSTFTAEELFGVELVMQNKGSQSTKTLAGRPLMKIAAEGQPKKVAERMSAGTVACVSGFLINIKEKTVKLVSPTVASDEFPNGYIEFASERYENPGHLAQVLAALRKAYMGDRLVASVPIRFSKGVGYSEEHGVPRVVGRAASISNPAYSLVGPHINTSTKTPMHIVQSLAAMGEPPVKVVGLLEHLWSNGVIEHVH